MSETSSVADSNVKWLNLRQSSLSSILHYSATRVWSWRIATLQQERMGKSWSLRQADHNLMTEQPLAHFLPQDIQQLN
jgi:hypothetical protein